MWVKSSIQGNMYVHLETGITIKAQQGTIIYKSGPVTTIMYQNRSNPDKAVELIHEIFKNMSEGQIVFDLPLDY